MNPSEPGQTCRSCGYSLAGLTDGVCPECGVRVSYRLSATIPPRIGRVMTQLVLSTVALVAIAMVGAARSGDPFKAAFVVCGVMLACGVSALLAGGVILDRRTFKDLRRENMLSGVVHVWCVLLLALSVVSGLVMLW